MSTKFMLDKTSNFWGELLKNGKRPAEQNLRRIPDNFQKRPSFANCPDNLKSTTAACRINDDGKHQTKDCWFTFAIPGDQFLVVADGATFSTIYKR